MTRKVDLNDFWRGNVQLANFASQLMTEREDRDDSIWSSDPYGSTIREPLTEPGARELVRREIERVSEVTGTTILIDSIDQAGANLRVVDISLTLTPNGLTTEETE